MYKRSLLVDVLLIGTLVLIVLIVKWKGCSNQTVETTNNLVVKQTEALGKLELVKYHIKDIVEHQIVKDWLPDPKAILIINAEAVGCIDFKKIKKEDIKISNNQLEIKLPKPELCYVRIDHSKSKVFQTQFALFEEAKLVDDAYKAAEKYITSSVEKMDLIAQSENNARSLLLPMYSSMGFEKVTISFKE